jgi:hypothetical protein
MIRISTVLSLYPYDATEKVGIKTSPERLWSHRKLDFCSCIILLEVASRRATR